MRLGRAIWSDPSLSLSDVLQVPGRKLPQAPAFGLPSSQTTSYPKIARNARKRRSISWSLAILRRSLLQTSALKSIGGPRCRLRSPMPGAQVRPTGPGSPRPPGPPQRSPLQQPMRPGPQLQAHLEPHAPEPQALLQQLLPCPGGLDSPPCHASEALASWCQADKTLPRLIG